MKIVILSDNPEIQEFCRRVNSDCEDLALTSENMMSIWRLGKSTWWKTKEGRDAQVRSLQKGEDNAESDQ